MGACPTVPPLSLVPEKLVSDMHNLLTCTFGEVYRINVKSE